MKKQQPTIKIDPQLLIELRKEKLIDRETDSDLIKRILHSYRKIDWEAQA